MITIAKHTFRPEAPTPPFKTALLSELKRSLLAKRLNRFWPNAKRKKFRPPWGHRHVWGKTARHPTIVRAEQWCETKIMRDLRSGDLITHVLADSSNFFRRVPSEFWAEKHAGLSLGGALLHPREEEIIPRELLRCTIYIFDDDAVQWLARHHISHDSPFFPGCLIKRPQRPDIMKIRQPRDSHVKKWFIKMALTILEERGGLNPEFKKADLGRELLARRPVHWEDAEPGDSSIKRYVNEAVQRHEAKLTKEN